MAEQQQNASNSGAYLIRGAAILGGAAEDLLIRDGLIAGTRPGPRRRRRRRAGRDSN